MLITIGKLRSLLQEVDNGGPGVKLVRVGGLSPVKQARGTAPERWGVWAFIWPYVEPFLLGSTGPEGAHPGEGKTRYQQMQREGFKRFVHRGRLYARLPVPGAPEVNGWYLTDGVALASYLSKHFAITTRDMRKDHYHGLSPQGMNPWSLYSKDEFEVFVPRPDEEGF